MNIFINISHPAHVHLFKNAIGILKKNGNKIIVGARKKEFTIRLLNAYNIQHMLLTDKGSGVFGLLRELIVQQFKIAKIIKQESIDLMVQMNGIFNAPIGKFFGIPTLALSDTENDIWANRISFALSKHVFSPTCFDVSKGGIWKNQRFYAGYHELAYLTPKYFKCKIRPKNRFLVRFVGWKAGHDIGEKGLSDKQKFKIVNTLHKYGDVYVSSESALPFELKKFQCTIDPSSIHKFMTNCKLVVGESATMTSEAACLGIPALFISNTGRGYTTEQDQKYHLVKHYRLTQWKNFMRTLESWSTSDLFDNWQKKRWKMLAQKIEVTDWLVSVINNYPESIVWNEKDIHERINLACAG